MDIYKVLAKKLDEMPNGYPATDNGVELKILRKIFTPEEAEMATKLKSLPETVEQIAKRLEKTIPVMQQILDFMAEKGQIACMKLSGQDRYMLIPFIIGIYEFQLNRLDNELAELFDEYAPFLMKTVGGAEPALTRVVPVNAKIDPELEILPYENVMMILEKARSFSVRHCICRWHQALEGNLCKHSLETCLYFSGEENAFEKSGIGRPISKEDAIKILEETEKEGLIHNTYNIDSGHIFICNCCPCCCGLIKGMKEHKAPWLMARSNFVAYIDQDTCQNCSICLKKRCPVDAITESDDIYTVIPERCIGCGVCTTSCPSESIILRHRPDSEHNTPAKNLFDWRVKRSRNRKAVIKNKES